MGVVLNLSFFFLFSPPSSLLLSLSLYLNALVTTTRLRLKWNNLINEAAARSLFFSTESSSGGGAAEVRETEREGERGSKKKMGE